MGDGLGAVDDHDRAVRVRCVGHRADGEDGAEDVGDVREGDDPGAGAQQGVVGGEVHGAVVVQGDDPQPGALLGAQQLPGDDVGVVFEGGEDDLVAGAHASAAPGLGDQVDAFGGAPYEDDLLGPPGPDETRDPASRALQQGGGLTGEGVCAPVHVRVVVGVEVAYGVDDLAGFVGGGGAVEPDERAAADSAREGGEVGPYGVHGEGRWAGRGAPARSSQYLAVFEAAVLMRTGGSGRPGPAPACRSRRRRVRRRRSTS